MNHLNVFIIGHSHVSALIRGWDLVRNNFPGVSLHFMSLIDEKYRNTLEGRPLNPATPDGVRRDLVIKDFKEHARIADVVVFCLNGNEHNNLGMFEVRGRSVEAAADLIASTVAEHFNAWMNEFAGLFQAPACLLCPPPPVESAEFILNTDKVRELSRPPVLRPASVRLEFWRSQCNLLQELGARRGFDFIRMPAQVFSADGFLASDCYKAGDISHGSRVFGQRVLPMLIPQFVQQATRTRDAGAQVLKHPYVGLPDYMYWSRAVGQQPPAGVDPVVEPPFSIGPTDKVATAGSCFAQHISKRLRAGGFHFLVTEGAAGPSNGPAGAFHDFSARYGNIYTARQLLQLFERAFGYFTPLERSWRQPSGRFCDPFRPTIKPEGYASESDVLADAERHLAAVRTMFRELDVFVFTLGLTECWISRLDGAAYPLAPGVAGGTYEPERHVFANFRVADVVADVTAFVDRLRIVNPRARLILTVSPVPLAATHVQGQHVLVSTTHSKAVLRVAAAEIAASRGGVYYFPSYEIIMNGNGPATYFESDRRTVTEAGVDHVMRVFMSRLTASASEAGAPDEAFSAEVEALNQALCDESMLDE